MGLMFVAFLFNPGNAKDLKYFSNFKPGPIIFGPESVVTDFVTITNDPGIDLPDKFTICSSLFIEVMTTMQNIIQILNQLTPTDKDVTLEVDSVALRKLKHGIQLSLCGSTYSVVFEWRHDIFVWASMRY